MGLCGSKQSKLDLTRLNLNEVFTDFVWNHLYPMDVGQLKAMLTKRKKYTVDIRWEYLEKTSDTVWTPRPQDIDVNPEDRGVMHYADYENTSGQEQNFSFSAERETIASATFEFKETYTTGTESNIEIEIPDVLKLGAGMSEEISMERGNSKTFQTRRLWNVNSNITINSGCKLKAEMKVVEKKTTSDFVVVNTMRFCAQTDANRKRVPYVIKDKHGKVLSVGSILNLEAPFRDRLPADCKMVTFKDGGRTMVIRVSGTCKSTTWQEQHVKVAPFTATEDANDEDGNMN